MNYWLGSLGPLRLSTENEELLTIWFSTFPISEKAVTNSVKRFGTLDLKGRLNEIFSFASSTGVLGWNPTDFFVEDVRALLDVSRPKALDTLHRVCNFVQIFELGDFLEEHQLLTLAGYYLMEFCGALTANLKYHLISLFNIYWLGPEEENLPKRGSTVIGRPGQLWAGPTLRYFRMKVYGNSSDRRIKRNPDYWEIALNSIFQGWKKGLLPISLEEVSRSMKEHSLAMKNLPTHDVSDLVVQVQRTVKDLYREANPQWRWEKSYNQKTGFSKLWVPSRHACVESNFGCFGFLGEFLRNTVRCPRVYGSDSGDQIEVGKPRHWLEELYLGLALRPTSLVGYQTIRGGVIEMRTKYLFYLQKEEIHSAVRKAVINLELPKAIPATVLEPNKARIITKGEYATYLPLKPFQRSFWSLLRRFPQFQLIGTKLNKEILHVVGKGYREGDVFVSGDYKAATDNFDYRLTKACIQEICHHLSPVAKYLCLRGLGKHEINYDPWKYQKLKTIEEQEKENPIPFFWRDSISAIDDTVLMESAQLMGSPLSFIVLCIVNFALTRHALEKSRGVIFKTIKETPILINGDDVLFPIKPSGVELWRDIVTRGGLSPSPGKNYVSSEFVQLNSEVYKVNYSEGSSMWEWKELKERLEQDEYCIDSVYPSKVVSEFRKIPYLNFGLMLDRHKDDSSVTERAGQFNFHSQYRDMVSDLLPFVNILEGVLEKSTELFEEHYREDLECFGFLDRNAPLAQGGLGLRPWQHVQQLPLTREAAYSMETGLILPDNLVKNELKIDPWTSYRAVFYEVTTKPLRSTLEKELRLQLKRWGKGQVVNAVERCAEKLWEDRFGRFDIPLGIQEEVSY